MHCHLSETALMMGHTDVPQRVPLQAWQHAAAFEAMGLIISHQRQPSARSLPAPGGRFPKEGGMTVLVYASERIFMASHIRPRHHERI